MHALLNCKCRNHTIDIRLSLWAHGMFDNSREPLLPLENIIGHVVLTTATICGALCWVTVPLSKVRCSYYKFHVLYSYGVAEHAYNCITDRYSVVGVYLHCRFAGCLFILHYI